MAKHNLSDDQLKEIQTWYRFNSKIKNFCKHSDAYTFQKIFAPYEWDENDKKVYTPEPDDLTKSEGYRLFQHFRFDCNHDYEKFTTYLTTNQNNDLYDHLVRIIL